MGLICRIYLIKEEWAKVSLTVGQFDLGLFFFGRKGCVENNEFILKYVACSIRNLHCRNNLSQQVILPLNCCDKRTMRFNKIKDKLMAYLQKPYTRERRDANDMPPNGVRLTGRRPVQPANSYSTNEKKTK